MFHKIENFFSFSRVRLVFNQIYNVLVDLSQGLSIITQDKVDFKLSILDRKIQITSFSKNSNSSNFSILLRNNMDFSHAFLLEIFQN